MKNCSDNSRGYCITNTKHNMYATTQVMCCGIHSEEIKLCFCVKPENADFGVT